MPTIVPDTQDAKMNNIRSLPSWNLEQGKQKQKTETYSNNYMTIV